MDHLEKAKACLTAAREQPVGHPSFRLAVEHVEQGDLDSAAADLVDLDDPSLVLATMFLERRAVSLGFHAIDSLSGPLMEQVPSGALDYGWIARSFEAGWAAETAGHVSASRTASTEGRGGFSSLTLRNAVDALVDAGEAEKAVEQLAQFSTWDKRARSASFARVGVALDDDKLMNDAVDAAKLSPMIQDGGEEAEALGEVLATFASNGVAPDHAAVTACIKALLKLGKTRARKDVRSYGMQIGALAAARRDGAWRNHARDLLATIWSDDLKHPVHLLLAASGVEDADALMRDSGLDEELLEFYPDDVPSLLTYLRSGRGPLDKARVLKNNHRDVAHLFDAALKKARGWYQGIENIWGQLLLVDEARSNALFDELDAPEVALKNAALGLWHEGAHDRAASYLERALESGFIPRYESASPIFAAYPTLFEKAVECSIAEPDRTARMEALSALAQVAVEKGEWERAAEVIDRAIEIPRVEEKPEWTPWSLMGDRHKWTPVRRIRIPKTDGSKSRSDLDAVKELERDAQLQAYYMLAFQLEPEHLPALRKVMAKAPGGRGDGAQLKKSKLVEVALIDGDFDGAIDIATSMRDCRISGIGPAYTAEILATWLAANCEKLDDGRPTSILKLFQAAIPQDIAVPLLNVAVALSPKLQGDHHAAFVAGVDGVRSQLKYRDHAAVDAAVAVVLSSLDKTSAKARMLGAIENAATGIYVGKVFFMRALRHAGLLDDLDLVKRVLTIPSYGHIYVQCMSLERCERILWDAGAVSPLPELLRSEVYPSEVNDQVRRSVVVMANTYAPNPVKAIESAWLDAPPNEDQAREQIGALAEALGETSPFQPLNPLASRAGPISQKNS